MDLVAKRPLYRRQTTNVPASRLKHPLNPRIHLLLFNVFAALNLVHANLQLRLEPLFIGQQLTSGFLILRQF